MMIRRFAAAIAFIAIAATPALSQTPQTQAPKAPPATQQKGAPTAPQQKGPATAPVANKVNLNTATAQELDKLPQIGPARAKAIIDARAKGSFRNWDDFVSRKVVPANAEQAIKDLVTF
jgi:DNA uptake protein ComE-like DNA-binding protein